MSSQRTASQRRGLAKGIKGLPVLLLVITGSVGLSYFIQGRLDVQVDINGTERRMPHSDVLCCASALDVNGLAAHFSLAKL